MNVTVEQDGVRQVLHSCALPGVAVCGATGASQALELQQEAARFARCFPWLKLPPTQVFLVTERLYAAISPVWETGSALLSADLERTPEELEQQCRLLAESAVLLQRCLGSFPDPDHDYLAGEDHPEQQPGSGRQAVQQYVQQLREQLTVWELPLAEAEWTDSLQKQLDTLRARPAFMRNSLFWNGDGFCCAGQWLRVQTERCHLAGRRLYELGVFSFGRRCVEDSFHFYG